MRHVCRKVARGLLGLASVENVSQQAAQLGQEVSYAPSYCYVKEVFSMSKTLNWISMGGLAVVLVI